MKRIKQDPEEGTTYNIPNTNKYDNDNKNKNSQRDLHTSTQQRKIYKFDDRVQQLEKFKEQYGHCDVTRKYDIGLKKWCDNVRYTYKNVHKGENAFRPVALNPSRIKVLKELGFDFKSKRERNKANLQISLYEDLGEDDDDEDLDEDDEDEDLGEDNDEEKMIPILSFDDRIKALKEFKEKYGHLDVPWKSDRSLYLWCSSMRSGYKRMQNGRRSNCGLTNERIQILKDLGFDFRSSKERSNPSSSDDTAQKGDTSKEKVLSFDIYFDELKKFKEKYGHCEVTRKFSASLSTWCYHMRSAYKSLAQSKPNSLLNPERVRLLEDVGFDFKYDGLISSNSILAFPQRRKRKQPNSPYSNQTSSNQRIKSELDISTTGSAIRPGSPAFDLSRFTYEELLQQAEENKAMCQRMEMKAKIRCKKSLTEIESSIFNTDEEDNSKGTFECRFCGLKFNFQCVCILHMPKCKAKTLNDPVWIQKHES